MLNEDYKEMLRLLKEGDVRFLVIGAYALGVYGFPRATGDIDVWVMAEANNSEKIYKVLKEFGAPLNQIDKNSFADEGIIFQIGVAPRRIDIITKIDGVKFDSAYQNRQEVSIDGIRVPVISKADLIKNKVSTGREKDLLDAKQLQLNNE